MLKRILMILNFLLQGPIPDVPTIDGDAVNQILAWIVGVLIVAIIGIVVHYEKKLTKVSDRLDEVIDESMKRMERSEGVKDNFTEKMSTLITKLHEILVITRSR